MVEEVVGMRPDIRVGGCEWAVTLGLWVVGIKKVTHPLEDGETGKKEAAVPGGRAHFVPALKALSWLRNPCPPRPGSHCSCRLTPANTARQSLCRTPDPLLPTVTAALP